MQYRSITSVKVLTGTIAVAVAALAPAAHAGVLPVKGSGGGMEGIVAAAEAHHTTAQDLSKTGGVYVSPAPKKKHHAGGRTTTAQNLSLTGGVYVSAPTKKARNHLNYSIGGMGE